MTILKVSGNEQIQNSKLLNCFLHAFIANDVNSINCDNNNKCKNKHHAAIKKQELLRYREEESFKLRREFAIKCLNQLCKFKKNRHMRFEEFEFIKLDLNDDIFFKTRFGAYVYKYKIDFYTIYHYVKAGRIYISS